MLLQLLFNVVAYAFIKLVQLFNVVLLLFHAVLLLFVWFRIDGWVHLHVE